MTLLAILKLSLTISIVLSVLALAMRARVVDLTYLLSHWRLGLGAIAAMYVIVPAIAIVMCLLLDLRPAVEIALIATAFSPMPPILPGKQLKAGGRPSYTAGLMVLTTAAAVVIAPLGVGMAGALFNVQTGVSPGTVATVVGITVALPLVLGLAAGAAAGERAHGISAAVGKLGHILLALTALTLVVVLAPALWAVIGQGTLIALGAMAFAGIAVGYLLGGPDTHDKAALSLAAATRHPGVAIAIASGSFPEEKLASAAVVLGLLVSTIFGLPFLRLLSKATHHDQAADGVIG